MDTKPNGDVSSAQNASTSAKVLQDDTAEQSNVKEEWDPATLKPHEIFWKNKQKWLEEKGYRLRPRYAPEWVPSWQSSGKDPKLCEDGLASINANLMDATRISDNEMVMLKHVQRDQVAICKYLFDEPLISHPQNHCAPVSEILRVPDDYGFVLLVMPLLRKFDDPRFETMGEAVEFIRQIFEGVHFMHQCKIAHRHLNARNIMMDPRPIFPNMYHPQDVMRSRDWKSTSTSNSRTMKPVKYYIVDLDEARRYEKPEDALERSVVKGEGAAPEFQNALDRQNPFPTDVYYIGNVVRETFLKTSRNFDFIAPLVRDMVQDDPAKRPTMEEVSERFGKLYQGLGSWKLRARLIMVDEKATERIFRGPRHFFRAAGNALKHRSARPEPPEEPPHSFPFAALRQ